MTEMTDNIALGGDGHANHALAVLRSETREGELGHHVSLVPGVDFNADPALEPSGRFTSPAGRVVELDFKAGPNPGGWVGLHVKVPAEDLRNAGAFGFAARLSAPDVQVARACLRSGTPDGFQDCFFDKHLLFRPDEASHVDALPIHHRDLLPIQAPWRELVFFLPTRSFQLSVIDLRLFVV